MSVDNKEDLIKNAIYQLLRVANKYARIEKQPILIDEAMEVSTREIHTIQVVGERDRISVTDVANHFGVTKSAASQIIAKLQKKGLIEKKLVPGNNKELHLALTALGRKAFKAHEKFHGKDMANLINLLEAYPLQQIATLSVLLEAIGTVMDKRLGEQ